MNGQRHLLREWFPDCTIIYLERDHAAQFASMIRVGMGPDYFGLMSGHGVTSFYDGWVAAHVEGWQIADYSLTYRGLITSPGYYLRDCAATMGCDQDDMRELAGLVRQ